MQLKAHGEHIRHSQVSNDQELIKKGNIPTLNTQKQRSLLWTDAGLLVCCISALFPIFLPSTPVNDYHVRAGQAFQHHSNSWTLLTMCIFFPSPLPVLPPPLKLSLSQPAPGAQRLF